MGICYVFNFIRLKLSFFFLYMYYLSKKHMAYKVYELSSLFFFFFMFLSFFVFEVSLKISKKAYVCELYRLVGSNREEFSCRKYVSNARCCYWFIRNRKLYTSASIYRSLNIISMYLYIPSRLICTKHKRTIYCCVHL